MKSKKKKPLKICGCGRIIKQKYYSLCVKCRQQRKRDKKLQREIEKAVKEALD